MCCYHTNVAKERSDTEDICKYTQEELKLSVLYEIRKRMGQIANKIASM